MWARQGSNLQLDRCELSADLKHRLGSFTAVGPAPSLTAAGWLLEFSTTIVNRGFDSHSLRHLHDFVRQTAIFYYVVLSAVADGPSARLALAGKTRDVEATRSLLALAIEGFRCGGGSWCKKYCLRARVYRSN